MYGFAGNLRQPLQKAVVAGQPGEAVKNFQRRARNVTQRFGTFAGLFAHAQRDARSARRTDLRQRRAAQRGAAPVGRNVAVQRTRHVGQHDDGQAKRLDDFTQLVNVAGREVAAGQQRDLVFFHRQRFDQRLDDGGDGVFKTVFKAAHIVGRGDINDFRVVQLGFLFAHGDDVAVHVVAFGFGQAGRADGDDLGRGALADIQQGRFDVVVAAQNRGDFVHRRGLQRDGFFKVAHQQHQPERGAALRAVHDRHAGVQPEEGKARAQRRAHLERIHRTGFFGFDNAGHKKLLRVKGGFRPELLRVPGP